MIKRGEVKNGKMGLYTPKRAEYSSQFIMGICLLFSLL